MPDNPHGDLPVHPDLAGWLLGQLDPEQAAAFERHLPGCETCRTEVEELEPVVAALVGGPAPVEMPAEARARAASAIGARMDAEAGATRATAGPTVAQAAPTPAPAHHAAAVVPLDARRSHRRLLVGVAAAAAMIGILLGATGAAVVGRRGGDAGRRVELVAPAGGPARGSVRLQRVAAGWTADLDVAGVPPSPVGFHYECWWAADATGGGTPPRITAGTFLVPASGSARVTLATAASPARYPRVVVGLEPDDGDPQYTSTVLVSRP